jgi:hypothetical protein
VPDECPCYDSHAGSSSRSESGRSQIRVSKQVGVPGDTAQIRSLVVVARARLPTVGRTYVCASAITAGLTLEWSNGITEGHVHRLKLVKRPGLWVGRLRPTPAARLAGRLGAVGDGPL